MTCWQFNWRSSALLRIKLDETGVDGLIIVLIAGEKIKNFVVVNLIVIDHQDAQIKWLFENLLKVRSSCDFFNKDTEQVDHSVFKSDQVRIPVAKITDAPNKIGNY